MSVKLKFKLFIINIICIVYVLCEKFIFANMPEIFNGGQELCDIGYSLTVGYIISYLFYVLVVQNPEMKREKLINACIYTPLNRMVNNAEGLIEDLKNGVYDKDTDLSKLTEKEILDICNKINIFNKSPMQSVDGGEIIYKYYIEYKIKVIEAYSDEVLKFFPLLDPYLILLINGISNSCFHEQYKVFIKFDAVNTVNTVNTTLEFLKNDIVPYYEAIKKLKEYTSKSFKN